MFTHVSVVSQHTHWHVGGYFGQLSQDVVKGPGGNKKYIRYIKTQICELTTLNDKLPIQINE